jgi:hypothetical protein
MGVLRGILEEERDRLKEVEKGYLREIAKLPAGSIQIKKIKECDYPYHVSSKKGKVRCKYLGKLPDAELEELKSKIVLRKKYRSLLKDVRSNQKMVKRALRGKK